MDLLKPQVAVRVRSKQANEMSFHDLHCHARHFSVWESVMVCNLQDGPHWVPGDVVTIVGLLLYEECEVDRGETAM